MKSACTVPRISNSSLQKQQSTWSGALLLSTALAACATPSIQQTPEKQKPLVHLEAIPRSPDGHFTGPHSDGLYFLNVQAGEKLSLAHGGNRSLDGYEIVTITDVTSSEIAFKMRNGPGPTLERSLGLDRRLPIAGKNFRGYISADGTSEEGKNQVNVTVTIVLRNEHASVD